MMYRLLILLFHSFYITAAIPLHVSDDLLSKLNKSIATINQYISSNDLDRFGFGETEVGGSVFGWTLGPGQIGGLATIQLLKTPEVNVTYVTDEKATVYQYRLVLGLHQLFILFRYQFKTLEIPWGHTEIVFSSDKNSMDAECDVILWDDGRCAAYLRNPVIHQIKFAVSVLPKSILHYIMSGFIKLCTNLLVWRTRDSFNEVVQEFFQLIVPDSPFSDLVCKAYVK